MNKLKNRIINLGLSYKKEITTLIAINALILLLMVVPFLLNKLVLLIPIGLMLPLFNFIYIYRYKSMEESQAKNDLNDFVMLFTFFRIYIRNGYSVYTSLKEIRNFANPSLGKHIDELVNQIDVDKTITPFINFAHNFNDLLIEEMMISIYQMIDDGNNTSYLTQFELIFDKFSSLLHEKQIENKDHRLATMSYGPLIGSALLILMITVGIVAVIGDMMHGI